MTTAPPATRRARTGVIALAAAAAVTATAFTAPAQAAPAPPSATDSVSGPPTGHQETRRALEAVVAAGIPGVVAATRDDRHGTWRTTVGVGNRTTGAPRSPQDRFRIASITKTFVATVLLQMEAEGRLDLDDSVETHLPGLVHGNGNDGRKISVRQLLNHTSGLFDYLADPAYAEKYLIGDGFLRHRHDTLAPEFHVGVALAHPPLFAPGADASYSNTNYVLAALVIESVAGRDYEDEVRERIIEPLRLRGTSQPRNGIHLPRPSSRAYSTLFLPGPDAKIHDVTEMNGSQGWGDGDIISTAGDLNRFFGALMKGKLLPKKQLAAMKTTVWMPNAGAHYGLGITRADTSCGIRLWSHGGGIAGSLSGAYTTEDGRRQLAFNLNGDWADGGRNVAEAEFCGRAVKTESAKTGSIKTGPAKTGPVRNHMSTDHTFKNRTSQDHTSQDHTFKNHPSTGRTR
ncbi:serine hydrolase domain-containing protein [Streptomyces yaizuensis]|uniref:Serine hydrolase n=1 Tax=Streptomyces yaizuensis TaxID=2989713 RepID=A0ABQ5PB05_9ACTN|nr:serine hydrolase domain-containing protein [Streptomyces sp. YSPA8]GLF99779.1 serine hydrolase [Streptomyces sp. YSPA8]